MADIRAFRAYRYDLGRVGALADVVAPPYDVIDPDLQSTLYDQSPYNVIRLILNRETPRDTDADNRYTRSARTLRDWVRDGILAQDSNRNLYVYHQDFEAEGKRYTRKGFLARVRLEPFGKGKIFPHEETMPGPKADRLKLFHATGMNLSPVFGLFPDPQGEVQLELDRPVQRTLPLQATDHLGVVSKLWPVADQAVVARVTGLMGPRSVFIADGHHRYETGLRYLEERRAAGEVRDDEAPANFILMMLVGMNDPGLVILPTHRLVTGIPGLTAARLREVLEKNSFQTEAVGQGDAGAKAAWELIEADGGQNLLGFGTRTDGTWQVARYQGDTANAVKQLAPEHSPDWGRLAVSLLHVVVLGKIIPQSQDGKPQCRYVHLVREVTEVMAGGGCDLAVLVPPATMNHVETIAGNLEKMPPKSTYFFPKLLSGLVFNPLTTN